MTGNTQHIIKQLFRGESLEDISLSQLEELVQLYPSFGIGHYLLSKKLQQENNEYSFSLQTQKTALYFNNPFWLQWLLKNGDCEETDRGQETSYKEQEIRKEDEKMRDAEEESTDNQHETGNEITPEILPDGSPDAMEPEQHEMDEQIGRIVSQQAADASEEIKEQQPAFEPYYTIDYFASQGIKFIQEANPADRLGRQLKSFTEWLKTMKKLPQKSVEPSADDDAVDPNIEISAAHSIEEKEVVTETMAEVLMKQGKVEKAAEVYRKLSLLNPDKSAYFAARIEQLKVH